jgi:hypothetical protein
MTPFSLVIVRHGRAVAVRRRDAGAWREESAVHANAARELNRLARETDGYVGWLDERLDACVVSPDAWPAMLAHDLEVLHTGWLDHPERAAASLGYIDFSSLDFFPVDDDRRRSSWLISAGAGLAHASILRSVPLDDTFEHVGAALVDMGGRGRGVGVCAYSEPALATDVATARQAVAPASFSNADLARLTRRLYGSRWALFWLICRILFERSVPLWSTLRACTGGAPHAVDAQRLLARQPLVHALPPHSDVDVIVPTLGRPQRLLDLLSDLSVQTRVPRAVVVIEQDPTGSAPASSPLTDRSWPFMLVHHRVTWTGACRARNAGIDAASAAWLLFLDDDVRLTPRFIEYTLGVAAAYRADVVTGTVHSPGDAPLARARAVHVTSVFPTSAGLVSRAAVAAGGPFDRRLERGWGEDFEFGLRLRRAGATLLQASDEPVLHLHDASGGFRTPMARPWDHEPQQPKPSPTMLLSRRGLPLELQRGYRLFYTVRRLSSAGWLRVPVELSRVLGQWKVAEKWATHLAGLEFGSHSMVDDAVAGGRS